MKTVSSNLFAIIALLAISSGCISPRNPLSRPEGWKLMREQDPRNLDPALVKDYQEYVNKLPRKERIQLSETSYHFFERTNGQHAVFFEIGRPAMFGEVIWAHVLIYDAKNKRVKAMKYRSDRSVTI